MIEMGFQGEDEDDGGFRSRRDFREIAGVKAKDWKREKWYQLFLKF